MKKPPKHTHNILSNNIWYLNVCVSVRRCIIKTKIQKKNMCLLDSVLRKTANGGDIIYKKEILRRFVVAVVIRF